MSIINLLPDDYLERRQRRRTNTLCVFLFALLMAGIVTGSFMSQQSLKESQVTLSGIEQSYTQAAQTVTQMQRLQEQQKNLLKKHDQIAKLLDRVPKSIVLATVTNSRPGTISLVSMRMETKIPKIKQVYTKKKTRSKSSKSTKASKTTQEPEKRPAPIVSLEVTGLASTDLEVARYISNLGQSGLMKSVSLVFSQEKTLKNLENTPMREFRIKCILNAEADATILAEQAARALQDETSHTSEQGVRS